MGLSEPEKPAQRSRAPRLAALGFFVLVVIGRLGVASVMGNHEAFERFIPDSYEYEQYARSILNGHYGLAPGWQQIPELKNNASWGYLYDTDGHGMFRPPGYPAVWAGLI